MRQGLLICFVLLTFACDQSQVSEEVSKNPRFNHVMLYVSDTEASIDFYKNAFGMSLKYEIGEVIVQVDSVPDDTLTFDLSLLSLPGSNFLLELSEQQVPEEITRSPHFQHLGIEVDDIEAATDIAVQSGAEKVSAIRTITTDFVKVKNVFFRGPDGELIELMEILEGEF